MGNWTLHVRQARDASIVGSRPMRGEPLARVPSAQSRTDLKAVIDSLGSVEEIGSADSSSPAQGVDNITPLEQADIDHLYELGKRKLLHDRRIKEAMVCFEECYRLLGIHKPYVLLRGRSDYRFLDYYLNRCKTIVQLQEAGVERPDPPPLGRSPMARIRALGFWGMVPAVFTVAGSLIMAIVASGSSPDLLAAGAFVFFGIVLGCVLSYSVMQVSWLLARPDQVSQVPLTIYRADSLGPGVVSSQRPASPDDNSSSSPNGRATRSPARRRRYS